MIIDNLFHNDDGQCLKYYFIKFCIFIFPFVNGNMLFRRFQVSRRETYGKTESETVKFKRNFFNTSSDVVQVK